MTDEEFENFAKKSWETEQEVNEKLETLKQELNHWKLTVAKLSVELLKLATSVERTDHATRIHNLKLEILKTKLMNLEGDGK